MNSAGLMRRSMMPLIAIITWIERTDHRRRWQDILGRSPPTGSQTVMNPIVSPAA